MGGREAGAREELWSLCACKVGILCPFSGFKHRGLAKSEGTWDYSELVLEPRLGSLDRETDSSALGRQPGISGVPKAVQLQGLSLSL